MKRLTMNAHFRRYTMLELHSSIPGAAMAVTRSSPWILITVIALASGCSADGTGPGGELPPDEEVSAMVYSTGGSLTTTGSNGVRYTLTVPAAAIQDSVRITMTPVAATEGVLAEAGLQAGVQFAPDGLTFVRPAILTIEFPPGASIAGAAAFHASGDGADPNLVPGGAENRTVSIPLSHFSTAGVVANAELIPEPPPSAVREVAGDVIMRALGFLGSAPDAATVQTIITTFRNWFDGSVRVKLQAAASGTGTDESIKLALSESGAWSLTITTATFAMGTAGEQLIPALSSEISELRELEAAALRAGIARNNGACAAQPANLANALAAANNVLYWQEVAEQGLLPADFPDLELAEVLGSLCLRIVYTEVGFPDEVETGQSYPLQIRAGYQAGSAPPILEFTSQVPLVDVQPVGASAANPSAQPLSGFTDGDGRFATSLTIEEGAAVINVHTCALGLLPTSRVSRLVCTDSLVVRNAESGGISISPVSATLAPDAVQQFTATIGGTGSQDVTWQATGGTYTTAGNVLTYTAGTTPGSYSVTATSVADPTQQAVAAVEIVEAPGSGSFELLAVLPVSAGASAGQCALGELLQGLGTSLLSYQSPVWECTDGDPPTTIARARVGFDVSTVAGASATISAQSTVYAVTWPEGGSAAVSHAGFRFRINGAPVPFQLTGSLNAGGEGTASATIIGLGFEADANSGTTQVVLSESGLLPPGEYSLLLSAIIDRNLTGDAAYDVTLTLGE